MRGTGAGLAENRWIEAERAAFGQFSEAERYVFLRISMNHDPDQVNEGKVSTALAEDIEAYCVAQRSSTKRALWAREQQGRN